jgi:uncharacterized protein YlxW (UPF0749 family)
MSNEEQLKALEAKVQFVKDERAALIDSLKTDLLSAQGHAANVEERARNLQIENRQLLEKIAGLETELKSLDPHIKAAKRKELEDQLKALDEA